MRIMLKVPDFLTSKAEEIATLRKLSQVLDGSQSYLATLFTPQMVNWAADAIKADAPIDLFASVEALEEQVQELSDRLNLRAKEIVALKKAQDALLDDKSKREADYEGRLKNAAHEIGYWRDEAQRLGDSANKAISDAEGYRREVVELKAKLYDLEHEAGR